MSGHAAAPSGAPSRAVAVPVRPHRTHATWPTAIDAIAGPYGRSVFAILAMAAGTALWISDVMSLAIADLDDLGIYRAISFSGYFGLSLIIGVYGLTLHQRFVVPSAVRYVQALIVIFVLFGVTPLFEPVLGFRVSYRHAGVVDYIATTASVDPNIDAYFNWPGFFAFGAFINDVTGIENAIEIAPWAPLFYNTLYLAPVVMIMRTATRVERRVWAGVLVFYLGNWVGQDYFSPQATAYLLYLVMMALVLRWMSPSAHLPDGEATTSTALQRRQTSAAMLVVVVFLFAAIVPSHQLTPFAAVLSVSALVVARRCVATRLPIIMLVLLSAWMTFMASAYLSGNFSSLLSQVGQVGGIFEQNVNARIAGSADHQSVVTLRLALSALLVALAVLGYLRSSRRAVDTSMAICCGAPILLLALQNYGGEVLLRAYLFSLPFAAYFTATLLVPHKPRNRSVSRVAASVVVVALLAFTTTAFLIARYGNQRVDSFTVDEVAAVEELYAIAPPGSLLLAGVEVLPWKYQDYDGYKYRAVDDLDGVRTGTVAPLAAASAALRADSDAYLIVSRAQFAYDRAFGALPNGSVDTLERGLVAEGTIELVYENEDARIYRATSSESGS